MNRWMLWALVGLGMLVGCAGERERSGDVDCSTVGCAPAPPPGEECTAICGCCTAGLDGGAVDGAAGDDAGEAADGALDPDASSGESVECGSMTCGPGQYCLIECTCCGAMPVDGGPPPSADYSCHPIPAGCDATDLCSCSLSTPCGSGYCSSPLTVECPCA